jgi:hypothetical protein
MCVFVNVCVCKCGCVCVKVCVWGYNLKFARADFKFNCFAVFIHFIHARPHLESFKIETKQNAIQTFAVGAKVTDHSRKTS